MKLNNFLNLLDKLEIVINKSQGQNNSFKIYNIKYSKEKMILYRIKDITQHSNEHLNNHIYISTSMSIDILFEQTVNDSFFIGFGKFIKKCGDFSGQHKKINEIAEEFRKMAEMEDVLQSI
jgi:hypothetical protein